MAIYKGIALRNDLKELILETPMGTVDFMADKILPTVPVKEKSGRVPVLASSAGMKQLELKRAPRGTFQRGEWVWGNDNFETFERGYEEIVDNVEALENSEIFNEEVISAQIAVNQLKLAREKRVADAVFNATTFASDLVTPTNEWDDATNATPFANITTAYDAFFAKSGRARTELHFLMNDIVFRNVIRSDEVRNSVIYTSAIENMSPEKKAQFLADFFVIKKIDIATSFSDSTDLGIEEATFARLWSNEYGMLYLPSPSIPSWKVPGLGRQPAYSKFTKDYKLESYAEEQTDSVIIRARDYRGEYINTKFGVLLDNLTT